jgi:hypothetical protein
MSKTPKSFELSIYKDRTGRWVAVARSGPPGKERTVGQPEKLSWGEVQVLGSIVRGSLNLPG